MPESAAPPELRPEPLLGRCLTAGELDDQVLKFPFQAPPRGWFLAFAAAVSCMLLGFGCIAYTVYMGIGVWGTNRPVAWAFPIINFVFWIGIGHAGTLISAILLLFRARWRDAISRFSEAMTIFAVMTAAIFPVIHLGRPWLAYWLAPYPNQRGIWPNFRSPLMWDVFAVSTYFTVSLLFWYVGLIPDLASMRDRARGRLRAAAYGLLCLGWRGTPAHWRHFEKAYVLLAGLATGLVLSVHSVVSFDFASSIVPGWHMTIFPPYFVTGAIFSGFAMVVLVLAVVRRTMDLEHVITLRHLELSNKVILLCSCLMG
ncbi:MAG: polysulfide reductase NrfD, partial [Elusimicrobia bacterium]|nr:polysulfide reductase NrfD [Elusimicrobiota bacterium]